MQLFLKDANEDQVYHSRTITIRPGHPYHWGGRVFMAARQDADGNWIFREKLKKD